AIVQGGPGARQQIEEALDERKKDLEERLKDPNISDPEVLAGAAKSVAKLGGDEGLSGSTGQRTSSLFETVMDKADDLIDRTKEWLRTAPLEELLEVVDDQDGRDVTEMDVRISQALSWLAAQQQASRAEPVNGLDRLKVTLHILDAKFVDHNPTN